MLQRTRGAGTATPEAREAVENMSSCLHRRAWPTGEISQPWDLVSRVTSLPDSPVPRRRTGIQGGQLDAVRELFRATFYFVIPAKAGIQAAPSQPRIELAVYRARALARRTCASFWRGAVLIPAYAGMTE